MSHGHHDTPVTAIQPGPRPMGLSLGLETAKSTHNILRLLESASGWHPCAQQWRCDDDTLWHARRVETSSSSSFHSASLQTISFADPCTARVHMQHARGCSVYSLLQLSSFQKDENDNTANNPPVWNDGWVVVREMLVENTTASQDSIRDTTSSLYDTLHQYFQIEHGGGQEDYQLAQQIVHPDATLLAVGSDQVHTNWTAPAGALLEISRDTYLQGVLTQTPHTHESRQHDQIVSVDWVGPHAAVATVRVGNGAQTRLFQDHLFLGWSTGKWQIFSKVFAPHSWEGVPVPQ